VDGAGSGAEVVWAVILGTGAGSGIVVHGRPLVGLHRIAGEWGQVGQPRRRKFGVVRPTTLSLDQFDVSV
jgi:fructokinase